MAYGDEAVLRIILQDSGGTVAGGGGTPGGGAPGQGTGIPYNGGTSSPSRATVYTPNTVLIPPPKQQQQPAPPPQPPQTPPASSVQYPHWMTGSNQYGPHQQFPGPQPPQYPHWMTGQPNASPAPQPYGPNFPSVTPFTAGMRKAARRRRMRRLSTGAAARTKRGMKAGMSAAGIARMFGASGTTSAMIGGGVGLAGKAGIGGKMMAGLSNLAGPMMIATALKEARDHYIKSVIGGIKGGIGTVGSIVSGIASPNADPSVAIRSMGEAASSAGEKIAQLVPEIGFVVVAFGETGKALAGLMQNLDKTAERYGEYSPQIAQQQAIADVRQTLGDLRRSREIGPELSRYVQVQADLQQKFEDIKIKLLTQILKVVNPILELLEKVVPSGEGIDNAINALALPLQAISIPLNILVSLMPHPREEDRVFDPTETILHSAGGQTAGVPLRDIP